MEVDVRVAEGDPPDLVPADPDGGDGADLVEEIEELPLGDGGVEITNVQRGVAEGAPLGRARRHLRRRGLVREGARSRVRVRHCRQGRSGGRAAVGV